jgi:hypothetical protein
MKIDAIRIETLANGQRTGKLISTEYESQQVSETTDSEKHFQDRALYAVLNKDVELEDVDMLEDGDYTITLFQRVYVAASFVLEGQPIPTFSGKDCYGYMNAG